MRKEKYTRGKLAAEAPGGGGAPVCPKR